jgi:hypothetical protein
MYEIMLSGISWWSVLCGDARENVRRGLSSTGVRLNIVQTSEDFDCGISLNAIIFAEVCFFCAVDLDQSNVLLFESGSSFFVLWSKGLAMTAPGSKELSQDQIMLFDKVFEVVSLQIVDV